MKTLLNISISVIVGFALAIALVGSTIHVRAGGNSTASANGDVNGDGMVDVSDAVYTLLYLFKSGAPPVACADTPELVGRVDALEATNERIATALEELAHPCGARLDRFVDHGDGTVTDTCTGLMWQRSTLQQAPSWEQAIAYCTDLRLAGVSGWRLPTARELATLILDGRQYNQFLPVTGPAFGASPDPCWSSDEDALTDTHAWTVGFAGQFHTTHAKTDLYRVLAVRGP